MREILVLRIGNPETFVYWLNGSPGRFLGPTGQPVTVEITEDNYRSFLAVPAETTDRTPPIRTT